MGKDVNKEDDVAVLCASSSDFGVASKVITTPPPIVAARPALSLDDLPPESLGL